MGRDTRRWWQAVRRWLLTGKARESRRYYTFLPHRGLSAFGIPTRVWSVLANRRTIHPVPLLYIAVAGAGSLVGLALRRLTGIRWWIAPAFLLAAGWSFVFSTIWWGKHRRDEPLSEELLAAVAPRRAAARRRAARIQEMLDSEIPFFSLKGASELPRLVSYGSGSGSDRSSVWYGEYWISAIVSDVSDERETRRSLQSDLISHQMSELIDAHGLDHKNDDQFERLHDEARDLAWIRTTLQVDGEEREAWETRAFGLRARYARSDGIWVTVMGPATKPLPALARLTRAEREELITTQA